MRYRGDRGRFVPETTVRTELDRYLSAGGDRLESLTRQLQGGTLDLAGWQEQVRLEIKALHVNAATLAHGGRAQMSQADYGVAGRALRDQYVFLRDWAKDLGPGGSAPLDGRLVARARLYSEAARSTFERIRERDMARAGLDESRWVLHSADHCTGCPDQAAKGWVPAGSLPAIGSQPCGVRCKCTKSFRRSEQEVAA
jgi:hypothetical protein